MVAPSDEPEPRDLSENAIRARSARITLTQFGHPARMVGPSDEQKPRDLSPALPLRHPLFGLSSRGRVLAEGSALDLPCMVPRPGMASLPRCHPERSEGFLREWVSKALRPPDKSRGMNTYATHPLNSFGLRTYAMGCLLKSFGMNTCAKYPGGRGHIVTFADEKRSCVVKPILASAEAFCENLTHAPHTT
jgi:hypothetical protein